MYDEMTCCIEMMHEMRYLESYFCAPHINIREKYHRSAVRMTGFDAKLPKYRISLAVPSEVLRVRIIEY